MEFSDGFLYARLDKHQRIVDPSTRNSQLAKQGSPNRGELRELA